MQPIGMVKIADGTLEEPPAYPPFAVGIPYLEKRQGGRIPNFFSR
jgi:hypothetical protein